MSDLHLPIGDLQFQVIERLRFARPFQLDLPHERDQLIAHLQALNERVQIGTEQLYREMRVDPMAQLLIFTQTRYDRQFPLLRIETHVIGQFIPKDGITTLSGKVYPGQSLINLLIGAGLSAILGSVGWSLFALINALDPVATTLPLIAFLIAPLVAVFLIWQEGQHTFDLFADHLLRDQQTRPPVDG
ncbi:MAG: hypothetical protein MUF87_21765 [Anaerolineae bacterium]|jgi:hypothetical protein|nr:hypothetical protein [Anaerolineae bacterium]